MSVALVRLAARTAACSVLVLAATASAQEYQTALQVSPEWGSRCITGPAGAAVPDQGLQMLDCNNSPAQTFTYDQAKMRLSIGGLCVDANGGEPGAVVKLRPCDGSANQAWKLEQKGTFANLIGTRSLPRHSLRLEGERSGTPELELRGSAKPALAFPAEVSRTAEYYDRLPADPLDIRKCIEVLVPTQYW